MKRSTLKRGKPLRRGTKRLARGEPMTRGEGLSRGAGPKRGARLRTIGRRAQRERNVWRRAKRAKLKAAGGVCEVCRRHERECGPLDVHHLKARSKRERGEDIHDLANLLACCRECHDGIHDHTLPNWREFVVTRKGAPTRA